MTDRNFPSELLKLKGRQPLPQNHQNHINNMTDTSPRSFKSKWHSRSFVYEKKLLCSVVLVGFNLQSGVGLVSKKKRNCPSYGLKIWALRPGLNYLLSVFPV